MIKNKFGWIQNKCVYARARVCFCTCIRCVMFLYLFICCMYLYTYTCIRRTHAELSSTTAFLRRFSRLEPIDYSGLVNHCLPYAVVDDA